jgi:ATP-binding cassette subfamily C (CFTR/MRP) protein 1
LVDVAQSAFESNVRAGYKHALFWALYEVFKKEFWVGGICRGMADILLVVTPYTLRYLIQFAMDSYAAHLSKELSPPLWHGIAYLCGIITMLVIQSLTHNHYMYLLGIIGGQSRAILTSAIFDKSIRVLDKGKPLVQEENHGGVGQDNQDHTAGLLTGFMSFDCARIGQTASALHIIWTAPLSLLTALSLREFAHAKRTLEAILTYISDRQSSIKRARRLRSARSGIHRACRGSRYSLSAKEEHRE